VLAAVVVLAAAEVDAADVVDAAELVVTAGAVVGVEVAPPQAARRAMPATESGASRRNWRRLIRAVMALLLLQPGVYTQSATRKASYGNQTDGRRNRHGCRGVRHRLAQPGSPQ
jgi:hypothetical protein